LAQWPRQKFIPGELLCSARWAGTFLIEECLIDDTPCEGLEDAIREFQDLRGKWSGHNA
jgi:hypothetical protein